jgi:hypothetical protein
VGSLVFTATACPAQLGWLRCDGHAAMVQAGWRGVLPKAPAALVICVELLKE